MYVSTRGLDVVSLPAILFLFVLLCLASFFLLLLHRVCFCALNMPGPQAHESVLADKSLFSHCNICKKNDRPYEVRLLGVTSPSRVSILLQALFFARRASDVLITCLCWWHSLCWLLRLFSAMALGVQRSIICMYNNHISARAPVRTGVLWC